MLAEILGRGLSLLSTYDEANPEGVHDGPYRIEVCKIPRVEGALIVVGSGDSWASAAADLANLPPELLDRIGHPAPELSGRVG